MDRLRLILLLIGAGVIAGVYGWTRWQQRARSKRRRQRLPGEFLEPEAGPRTGRAKPEHSERLLAEQEARGEFHDPLDDDALGREPLDDIGEQVLVISVVAEGGGHFQGKDLARAFSHNELVFDETREIFVRRDARSGQSVFGLANLVKPGTLPGRDLAGFETPGITLFLQLPGVIAALDAYDDFVHTAERLAVELGGELRDEKRQLLTHQALMLVRERLAEHKLRHRAAAS
ncbi:MAG TPA: hypothetical protein ENJ79_01020 [Gammaproteobacteria bacterium]|nr:hypothetical protein [Gammaproteobacteria bacterium]